MGGMGLGPRNKGCDVPERPLRSKAQRLCRGVGAGVRFSRVHLLLWEHDHVFTIDAALTC